MKILVNIRNIGGLVFEKNSHRKSSIKVIKTLGWCFNPFPHANLPFPNLIQVDNTIVHH